MQLPQSFYSEPISDEIRSLILNLLEILEQMRMKDDKQQQQIEALLEELLHLKKLKGKPRIRPNVPDTEPQDQEDEQTNPDTHSSSSNNSPPPKSKRPKPCEPGETAAPEIRIDHEQVCPVEGVQPDWRNKGFMNFIQTELRQEFITTCYRRECWRTPSGEFIVAPLPAHVKSRFGDALRSEILDLYHSGCMTQPALLTWLHDRGCSISEGALSALLTKNHDLFHQEKDDILETGIACSRYLQVDDTGARHKGKSGVCTVIGNDLFTCFASTGSKSQINFLMLLQGKRRTHVLNSTAIDYMRQSRMAGKWVQLLETFGEVHFLSEKAWQAFLDDIGIKSDMQRRLASEGVLKGGLLHQGFPEGMIIHSDGAPQFDTVFAHSGCWYHASRPLAKLIPSTPQERAARDWMENQFWSTYDDLVEYQKSPTAQKKQAIENGFNQWVTTEVDYPQLRTVLENLVKIRKSLLLVLDYPWLPLHNNLSERQIREYVKRRKVSGGTRSDPGQMCRDTFASLKKTCRLHGISFSKYLLDRISGRNQIPPLVDLIRAKSHHDNPVFASGF